MAKWRSGEVKYLTYDPINIAKQHHLVAHGQHGASMEFVGLVRGMEDGQPISHLDYEAYAPMAERLIERLVQQAQSRWPLHAVYVRHRLGRVAVGEIAVRIKVEAPHREEAFEACRFLIDAIKREVPIWKTAGDQAPVGCGRG